MQILIPSTASAATIFLILSSPHACICLTSLKITSTQGRLYVPSVTSSMNSLSSSSFLDLDRALFFGTSHLTNLMFQLHFFSAVKAGATNVRDNAILPPLRPAMALVRALLAPTASGDGAGERFCAPLPPSPHFSVACPEKT